MHVYKLTRKAEDDLFDIREYTQDNWGVGKRDEYLDDIDARFHQLADNPDYPTARSLDIVKTGYFSLQVNEHIIIYRKYSYGVRIVRVLSQSMDVKLHI